MPTDWFRITATGATAEVAIEGEIHAGDARRFLAALPSSARRIALRITSPGGDAEAALVIAAGLRAHPARVSVLIEGIAASAATLPVMAGDRVEIGRDAAVMLHDPTVVPETSSRPGVRMLRDAAAALERVKDRMLEVYGWRLKPSRAEIATLMHATTWLDAEGAVRLGLADEVTPSAPALAACLDPAALATLGPVPARFARLVAGLRGPGSAAGDTGWSRAIAKVQGPPRSAQQRTTARAGQPATKAPPLDAAAIYRARSRQTAAGPGALNVTEIYAAMNRRHDAVRGYVRRAQ